KNNCRGIRPNPAAGQAGRTDSQYRSRTPATAGAPTERHHTFNEATTMTTRQHNPPVCRFDIDHGTSDARQKPRKQSNAQQMAPGYLWNSTTQELIPILPEDHPDYRENAETIRVAFRRWERGTSK